MYTVKIHLKRMHKFEIVVIRRRQRTILRDMRWYARASGYWEMTMTTSENQK